jgi:colanic acid/amylovoran biosynthesis glycosyltransferase
LKLAIVTNKEYASCETFIKAQIDHLPYNIVHYWGKSFPNKSYRNEKWFYKLSQKFNPTKRTPQEQLKANFIKDKVDLVLAQYGMLGAEVLPICKELNLPLVVHFHGHDAVRKTVLEAYKLRYQELFQYSKVKLISVSHEMTKKLVALGCPANKISYNTYGPNELFFKIRPKYNKQQFIAIGRFVDKKAPQITLQAFANLLPQYPEAKLILAGDGHLLESCKTLAKSLEIETQVLFPGRITPEQYAQFLEESLAFVQHSATAPDGDMEGTPVAILEASAAGLPVISTYHAGIPDVVMHGETGLLSQEQDVVSMSQHMMQILDNKSLAMQMGEAGSLRIKNHFSFQKHLSGLKNILDSAHN